MLRVRERSDQDAQPAEQNAEDPEPPVLRPKREDDARHAAEQHKEAHHPSDGDARDEG
jgi:hypothetical protein